ncbi:uncharacterized protein At4g04775-like [Brassica rapa]|uniref:uncharacterized protein At4g04775-like n=1 Tax=Brassica campestris TaxID=3711 RepID=UPI0006AA7A15|nr:uncharacterized protein At4g04775-like [Brassica rapa]
MSNESGNSSGTSAGRARGRVVGVPKRCWCGELVVSLMSKSTANPYRRYYRCAFAAEKRLSNDNHTYKWVDEALVDEAEALKIQLGRLEQTIVHERAEEERKKFAEFEMKLEIMLHSRFINPSHYFFLNFIVIALSSIFTIRVNIRSFNIGTL